MNKEDRLRNQLFLQSQQIERVFSEHRLPAQVSGGEVAAQAIRFDLVAQLEQGWERLRQLKQELLAALGVSDLQLVRDDGRLRLMVRRPVEPAVALLDLLPLLPALPPLTAVLGLDSDGHPLLVQLSATDVPHLLLGGQTAAGKSSLLRTMLLSLALGNRQGQCQLLVIDPQLPGRRPGKQLLPVAYLPHLLAPVAQTMAEAGDIVAFLLEELEFRQEEEHQTPAIVLAVESVVSLLEQGGAALAAPLRRLLNEGAAVGIHLLLTTRRTAAPQLDQTFRGNIPLWVYGTADESAPSPGSMPVQGEFLAVVDGLQTRFQAAYIDGYDSHLLLQQLCRERSGVIMAQPLLPDEDEAEDAPDAVLAPVTVPQTVIDPAVAAADEVAADEADDQQTGWL